MEKKTSEDEAASHKTPFAAEVVTEPTKERIVLPDECGDTLWDEVLAQSSNFTTLLNRRADT